MDTEVAALKHDAAWRPEFDADRGRFSSTGISGLTTAEITALTAAQLKGLTATEVGELTTTQLGALADTQIVALSPGGISGLLDTAGRGVERDPARRSDRDADRGALHHGHQRADDERDHRPHHDAGQGLHGGPEIARAVHHPARRPRHDADNPR